MSGVVDFNVMLGMEFKVKLVMGCYGEELVIFDGDRKYWIKWQFDVVGINSKVE